MTDITRAEVEAVTDELRKEHSEHRNIPGICHEDHEMYPCSTIRLLDRLEATEAENVWLRSAGVSAMEFFDWLAGFNGEDDYRCPSVKQLVGRAIDLRDVLDAALFPTNREQK